MRVISGKARGHKLKSPEGLGTRPTLDRIKESLFNMIQQDLYDGLFLDLFSGTGGIGIEALSRGAEKAVFVEKDINCMNIIKDNLIHTKLIDDAQLIQKDVKEAIIDLGKNKMQFNIIFMDAPYNKGYNEIVLSEIAKNNILQENGMIIVERDSQDSLENLGPFKIIKEKKYGIVVMTFLARDVY